METLAMIRQAFGEESMNRTRKAQTHRDRKRRDRWRSESRARPPFSLTSKGLFTKNSFWQAKRSIPHTTVTFSDDCVKVCEDFAPNFRDKGTGCCSTTTHHLTLPFSPGNFWRKQHDCRPYPPYFSLFPRLKLKLTKLRWSKQNRRRYWTPLQNTTSRTHLKNGSGSGNCIRIVS
jgi:hypothetical protein